MNHKENNTLIVRDFKKKFRMIDRGEGIYVFDTNGKRYIDGTSGSASVSNIGHGIQEVIDAINIQINKLAYTPSHYFTNPASWELADLIASITPEGLNQVWLVSDGSEATEAAVKFARQYQQELGHPTKSLVISRWQSYHGATLAALGYSGHTYRRKKFYPMYENVPHIPPAYCYRCYFGQKYPECGTRCAWALDQEIKQQGPQNVAAFIAEPLVGSALGAVPPVDEYFAIIREICDLHGVVFIADEVMTGFGRTGKMFAMQHWNIKPDIITCAKGISGGYVPLGAAILDEKIINLMRANNSNPVSGHTYGSHHVIAGAAVAVIKYMLNENLVERARENGEYFMRKMRELNSHRIVGDVRGKGLFGGIEFVKDKTSRQPFESQIRIADRVGWAALDRGLITYPGTGNVDGSSGDHILMSPPLTINQSQIDDIIEILDESIGVVEVEVGE